MAQMVTNQASSMAQPDSLSLIMEKEACIKSLLYTEALQTI